MITVGTLIAPKGAKIFIRDKRSDASADLFDLDNKKIDNPIITTHEGTQSTVRIHPAGVYKVIIESKLGELLVSYDVFAVADESASVFTTVQEFNSFVTLTGETLPIAQGGTGATSAAGAWAALIADAGVANVQQDLFGTPMPEFSLVDCDLAVSRGYHKATVTPLNAPYENFGACLLRTVFFGRFLDSNSGGFGHYILQDISQGVKSVSGRFGITGRWWRRGQTIPGIQTPLNFSRWRLG